LRRAGSGDRSRLHGRRAARTPLQEAPCPSTFSS
jgi:hypothetical protein